MDVFSKVDNCSTDTMSTVDHWPGTQSMCDCVDTFEVMQIMLVGQRKPSKFIYHRRHGRHNDRVGINIRIFERAMCGGEKLGGGTTVRAS